MSTRWYSYDYNPLLDCSFIWEKNLHSLTESISFNNLFLSLLNFIHNSFLYFPGVYQTDPSQKLANPVPSVWRTISLIPSGLTFSGYPCLSSVQVSFPYKYLMTSVFSSSYCSHHTVLYYLQIYCDLKLSFHFHLTVCSSRP